MVQNDFPSDFFISDTIDMMQLCHINPEFAHDLVLNPLEHESLFKFKTIQNAPDCLLVKDYLTKKNYNKIIKVQGTIIKVGPVVYKNVNSVLVCAVCKSEIPANSAKRKKILACLECGAKKLNKKHNLDNIMCSQTIKIQDITKKGPIKTIEAIFEGKKIEKIIPGDQVVITGIVILNLQNTFLKENEVLRYQYCLKGLNLEVLRHNYLINREFLDNYIEKKNKREFLILNFCKKIYGNNHIKLGIILCIIGTTTEKIRLNSHCLLLGDPGTGKTDILKYSSNMISPSRYVNGFTTSEVGLTACAIKQDKDWALEAGALVIADNGICCIDNFESLSSNEKGGLLEAMEQQTISIAKAGMNVKLNARGSIIAAGGYKSKKSTYFDLKNSTNISSPLLSRFDLIFGLFHTVNKEKDSLIADSMLNFLNKTSLDDDLRYLIDKIKKFNLDPHHDCNHILIAYYKLVMKKQKNAEINTLRIIEGLNRLALNHAKLNFSNKISDDDIFVAIFLFETTLRGIKVVNFDSERIFIDEKYFLEKKSRLLDVLNKNL